MSGNDYRQERDRALTEALKLHFSRYSGAPATEHLDRELIATSKSIFDFLAGPAFLFLNIGPVVHQDTGSPVANPLGGNPMQLRDNEQFTASVELKSARGNSILDQPGTQDDISWSVTAEDGTSGESLLTLEVSEDTRTATVKAAGPVGSAVLRAEIGELFVTEAVDVVPGEATLITVTTSEPTTQEEPTPEPEPTPGPGV